MTNPNYFATPVFLSGESLSAVEAPVQPGIRTRPQKIVTRRYEPFRLPDVPKQRSLRSLLDGRLLLIVALAAPFLLLAVQISRTGMFFTWGDQAFIDINVHKATRFQQLTGAYSRFGWDHPGPLYYYFLAPVYWLFSNTVRIYAGALFLNFVMVMTAVGLLIRYTGRRNAAAVALGLMAFLGFLEPFFLQDPWNPSVTVLALFTAVVAVAIGPRLVGTAVLIVCASLIVQAHVGTVLIVGSLVLLALALHVVPVLFPPARWLAPDAKRLLPSTKALASMEALLFLCWLPPLIEQVIHGTSGNLGKIAYFFYSQEGQAHTAGEAINKVVGALWLPNSPIYAFPDAPPISAKFWFLVALAVALSGAVIAWRRRSRVAFTFLAFASVGLPVSVLSVMRISGNIEVYLLWWIPVVGAVLLAGWLVILFGSEGILTTATASWRSFSLKKWMLPAACAGTALWLALVALHGPPLSSQSRAETQQAWAIISPQLGDHSKSYYLDIRDPQVLPQAAGVAVMLEDAGYRYEVPDQYEHVFGRAEDETPVATTNTMVLAAAGSGNDVGPPPVGVTEAGVSMSIRVVPN